jgi:hypothetical protein
MSLVNLQRDLLLQEREEVLIHGEYQRKGTHVVDEPEEFIIAFCFAIFDNSRSSLAFSLSAESPAFPETIYKHKCSSNNINYAISKVLQENHKREMLYNIRKGHAMNKCCKGCMEQHGHLLPTA